MTTLNDMGAAGGTRPQRDSAGDAITDSGADSARLHNPQADEGAMDVGCLRSDESGRAQYQEEATPRCVYRRRAYGRACNCPADDLIHAVPGTDAFASLNARPRLILRMILPVHQFTPPAPRDAEPEPISSGPSVTAAVSPASSERIPPAGRDRVTIEESGDGESQMRATTPVSCVAEEGQLYPMTVDEVRASEAYERAKYGHLLSYLDRCDEYGTICWRHGRNKNACGIGCTYHADEEEQMRRAQAFAQQDGELQSRAEQSGNPSSSSLAASPRGPTGTMDGTWRSPESEPVTADSEGQPRADEASRPSSQERGAGWVTPDLTATGGLRSLDAEEAEELLLDVAAVARREAKYLDFPWRRTAEAGVRAAFRDARKAYRAAGRTFREFESLTPLDRDLLVWRYVSVFAEAKEAQVKP
jgi:hypothetical protein